MPSVTLLLQRLGARLGNEGAIANAAALRQQRHHETWRIAALERSLTRRTTPLRRTA
jgi:hypothetical protein